MPLTPKEKEKLRYDKAKRKIANEFSVTWRKISLNEGISGGVLALLEGLIAVILALLLLPEPAISKAAAALIAAGAGLLGAAAALIILATSKDDFLSSVTKRNGDETSADIRHEAILRRLSNIGGAAAEEGAG